MRLRDCPPQMFEGAYVIREAGVYAFARDLGRLKQLLPAIKRASERIPGFRPAHAWAQGSYLMLRGSTAEACEAFEDGLGEIAAGEHSFHATLSANYLLSLLRLGDLDRAVTWGEEVLARTREVDLGPQLHVLLDAMARVRAEAGAHRLAIELAEEALSLLTQLGAGGLVLGGAHETRAWVSLRSGDQAAFERHARACAEIYRRADSTLLSARYRELMDAAASVRIEVSEDLASAAAAELARTMAALSISQVAAPGARARAALEAVVHATGAEAGLLYTLQADGPELGAQRGPMPPLESVDALVATYLEVQLESFRDATMTCSAGAIEIDRLAAPVKALCAMKLTPLLLTHGDFPTAWVTGVVLLRGADGDEAPQHLLATISSSLHDAGDVATQQASWA